jgi:CheY-like chemotaxis protein
VDEPSKLTGSRVFVVEDEMLVSMLVEDILSDFGCIVIGPAAKLDDAIGIAESEQIDIALLDINLGGTRVFPVAHVLAGRGVPFVFVSGYGDQALEAPFEKRPVLQKPFNPEAIGDVLLACLEGRTL